MWHLSRPGPTASDTYLTCISRISDLPIQNQMKCLAEAVACAEELYVLSAQEEKLYDLEGSAFTPSDEIVRKELIKTYTDRMAKLGAPGRPVYDQLMQASPHCPLCGHRERYTLDHYLPKAAFPLLSVMPVNLVPACTECNKAKSAATATTAAGQTLHPYFDDVDHGLWLKAEVVECAPPALVFSADPPSHWPLVLSDRVRHHFATFKLARLYAAQASTELRGIEYELELVSAAGGENDVRSHLQVRAQSWSQGVMKTNHWKTAAYLALAASSWYCCGGFSWS